MHTSGSVYCTDEKCTYKLNVLDTDGATAYGVFNDTVSDSGWGILNITAGRGAKQPENEDLMFAAGYLEGIMTQK